MSPFRPCEQGLSVSSFVPLSSVFSVPPFPHKSSHFSAFCLGDQSFGSVSILNSFGNKGRGGKQLEGVTGSQSPFLMQSQLLM